MLGEGPAGASLVDACAQVPLDRTLARGDIDGYQAKFGNL